METLICRIAKKPSPVTEQTEAELPGQLRVEGKYRDGSIMWYCLAGIR